MLLKTYNETDDFSSGLILDQLDAEIRESGAVTNFTGLSKVDAEIRVLGESMNETDLDALISSHSPDFTKVFVQKTVQESKAFADDMLQRLKERNLLEGLASIDQAAWVHHRLRKVDFTLSDGVTVAQIDVMNLVVSGDIETAESVLGQLTPDDMTQPYHWWTQERIDWVRNEIRAYLGWELI